MSSLLSLFSFDHSKCDAILQLRHIDIPNAFTPDKPLGDSVYIGFWWVVIWEALIVTWCVQMWKRQDPDPVVKYLLLPFAALGLYCLFLLLEGMVNYIDTCKSVLSSAAFQF